MNFFHLLAMDFRRAFHWRFWFLTLGIAVLFWMNLLNYPFYGTEDLVYRMMIGGDAFFLHVMLIPSTAVYAFSFCEDWDNRNIRNIYIRMGACKYAVSKVICCAVSAMAALFLGKAIFVVSQLPFVSTLFHPNTLIVSDSPPGTINGMLYQGEFGLWMFFNLLRFALEGTGFAVLSLAVSTVLTNKFVVLIVPLFAYFVYDYLTDALQFPEWMYLYSVYENANSSSNVVIGMLWPFVLSVLACCLFGWLFLYGVKRRLENG